jgi:branched-chain amino acid transport system ATP-binding protein
MTGTRTLAGALAVAAVAVVIAKANNYHLYVLALVGLTAMVGVGLNVLVGLNGQISLGHVAFYALGAYTVGILTTATALPFWAALPLAGAIAAAAGLLLAIPALRVRGPYLAMVTIAFGFIVEQGLAEWRGLTGGWNGLMGIPPPSVAGHRFSEREIAVLVLLLMAGTFWLYARLSAGAWGKAMRAVRDSEVAAQSIGLDPVRIRTVAFALSAAVAGVAGGIFAAMSDFISPESFPFFQSIVFLLVVMIGGADRTSGPLFGALVVVLLPEALSSLAQYRLLFVGMLLLIVLRLAPEGIVGLVSRLGIGRASAPKMRSTEAGVAFAPLASNDRVTLSVKDLSVSFGGVHAIRDLTFAAAPGRITSLIGPNGAGKSTVLNLACGFYRPQTGAVAVGNRNVAGQPSHAIAKAGIARTYQTTQLFSDMSVLDNVRIALRKGQLGARSLFAQDGARADDVAVDDLLAFVGYAGDSSQIAGSLPHVDKRLVEIARALATRPAVLMLDEPAAGLDTADTERLGKLLRQVADAGLVVVLVEHDMKLVMELSDHVVVLDAGQKIAEGPAAEIARNPQVLEAYLGHQAQAARGRETPLPVAAPPSPVLAATGLGAGYGPIRVIRDIDLQVADGELVAVLGANGAGKSTLMRALSGLNRPIDGSVVILGTHVERLTASRIAAEGLVLIPEGRQVFPELSVIDNIRLGGFARGDAKDEDLVQRLLDRFPRLRERQAQRAGLLSGGEQQMLAIARGLMARPTVLMLDEPSLGLAPKLVDGLYDLLAELRDEGTTILLVDQMAAMALSVADRAYVLKSGVLAEAGSTADLARDPALAEAYLGSASGQT